MLEFVIRYRRRGCKDYDFWRNNKDKKEEIRIYNKIIKKEKIKEGFILYKWRNKRKKMGFELKEER